jgi:hypothetical protein
LWPIIDPARQYYMEGELLLQEGKKFGFLFSDMLLLCDVSADRVRTATRMLFLSGALLEDAPEEGKHLFLLTELKREPLLVGFPTALKKRKWMRALAAFIDEKKASQPQPSLEEKKVAPLVRAHSTGPADFAKVPVRPVPKSGSTRATASQADVHHHPDVVALRARIADERKLREEAESKSDALKRSLQSSGSKSSKLQRATELEARIGKLCGLVGHLSSVHASLLDQVAAQKAEIDQLQSPISI